MKFRFAGVVVSDLVVFWCVTHSVIQADDPWFEVSLIKPAPFMTRPVGVYCVPSLASSQSEDRDI